TVRPTIAAKPRGQRQAIAAGSSRVEAGATETSDEVGTDGVRVTVNSDGFGGARIASTRNATLNTSRPKLPSRKHVRRLQLPRTDRAGSWAQKASLPRRAPRPCPRLRACRLRAQRHASER